MFDQFGNHHEAFAHRSGGGSPIAPLRRRKTIRERFVFWVANLILLPVIAMCYLSVGAEGLRQLMPVFQLRLWKLPVPGAGLMRNYDGFDRADLAMVFAFLLFVATTFVWIRVFKEIQGHGTIARQKDRNPILFFLASAVAAIILLGDAGIFYIGLEIKTASSWSDTPTYVPFVATAVYLAGLALIGAWHADYHCSGAV